ncbi:tripartite ATP-independent transporter solute receptor, DctP family [Franzmannia pantelleriensis]|uniref:Tripartite ATP-independent transporter solute receptor, DctP family n=1 Tax=Franzmannia pantelleriensis TaxID=48727 RepID=A0A1G9S192_9GAMM|nr:TRAP transporter substrate-binding protein [Halomonas pantelleriensis]SDM29236.1 tripartite ATP-independent transporter solute receptor, DctP family [Halomonas pantelleriensis]
MSKSHTLRMATLLTAGMLLSSSVLATERLRVAGNFPTDHSVSRAMEVFKEQVESASNGDISVELFPAMQLGGATENVDQVRSGSIFAVFTSIAYFTRSVPEYEAVSLPFLFDSRDQAFAVMDGPVGEHLDEKMAELGFVNLGYGELGFRHVTNNLRPITSVEDFEGMRIRLQPNEVHLQTFRALGANPVSMDVSELYSALQQGVLDGQENPYNIIASRRFNEVQEYLSDSGHFYDFINAVANQRSYERLSEEHRVIVDEAMQAAMEWQREAAAEEEESWREQLIEAGMEFTPISADLRAELREATLEVAESLAERVDPEFLELVIQEAEAAL